MTSPTPTGPSPEAITKTAAAVALVCFVSGLLVVQAYVYSLGFSVGDMSVLKARLVYTGALLLTSIALATLASVAAWQLGSHATRSWRRREFHDAFIHAGPAPVVLCAPWLLFVSVFATVGEGIASARGRALVAQALALFAGWSVLLVWHAATRRIIEGRAFLTVLFAVLLALSVGSYVNYFATEIYPRIPEQFGGGEPVRAWLQARDAEMASTLDEADVSFPAGSLRSDPVDLLYDDERILVVRRLGSAGATVRVERDAIVALRTDNRPPKASRLHTVESGRTEGVPEEKDQLAFVFSEPVDPETVLEDWDGSPTNVTLRFEFRSTADGRIARTLRVDKTALGAVTLPAAKSRRQGKFSVVFGNAAVPSTMDHQGSAVVVTLGAPSAPWPGTGLGRTWRWEPDASVRDQAGYELDDEAVVREAPVKGPLLL